MKGAAPWAFSSAHRMSKFRSGARFGSEPPVTPAYRAQQSRAEPCPAAPGTGHLRGDSEGPRWSWRSWGNARRKSSIAWWRATLLNVFCVTEAFSSIERDPSGLKRQLRDLPWEPPAEDHLISVLPLTDPLGLTRKEHFSERHFQEGGFPKAKPFLCSRS